jgi:5-methylcytosine-specific restriction endonuclease McrA
VSLRRRQAALRREVFARDKGCCSLCGLDTEALRSAYAAAKAQVYGAWRYERTEAEMHLSGTRALIDIALRHRGQIKAVDDRLRALGFEPGHAFFECHHALSVEEGGECALVNAITACVPCHRRLSAEHAARRARRPSKRVARRAA